MLIQFKQKHFYCIILFIFLLLYANNLFCNSSNKQQHIYPSDDTNSFKTSDKLFFQEKNRHLPAIKKNKKQQKAYLSEEGETAPWSNAFNFKKLWGTSVDPRTGILSAYVKTGSLLSNFGHGPNIDLEINYNSNTLADPDGLGTGWSWNLTHFNLITHQLTTSSGQNFYLQEKPFGRWLPQYHKLHDINISGNINTHFVITYANGLRETLNHDGYEVRLEQQDGWSVYFNYLSGTHLLQSITDDEKHLIKLRRSAHYITVISCGNQGQPVAVLLCQNNNEIQHIMLLSFSHQKKSSLRIHYVKHFITQVNYPTGLSNLFTYNCKDAMKVPIKYTISPASLCVVVKKTANPGFGEPVMINRYRYSEINSNAHNYLGFNTGINIIADSAKDILFKASVNYTYKTEQDNGITREVYTYNKYHLLIDDQKINDKNKRRLSETHYFFCRTDKYNGCAHTSFSDLPVTYSLPLKIETKVWNNLADRSAKITIVAKYDSQGRVIWKKDAYGRITVMHYCPLTGNIACPPVSDAWSFSTLTESTTLYPAHVKVNENSTGPLTTYNYYHKERNHNGSGYILVLDHQIQQAGKQRLITTHSYYHDPDNLLTYGLLKRTIFTNNQNKITSLNSIVKNYYYIKSLDNNTKTTYNTIELSAQKHQFSPYITTSLFTNQILWISNAKRTNTIHYYYDEWDRPIKTESATGTIFAASIYYCYTISTTLNQVLITAPNGLQQKIIFDGAGRTLIHFSEAIDASGKQQNGHWWPIQKTQYDQYGRIAKESSYNIDATGHTKETAIIQNYDATDRVIRTYLPDGSISFTTYDDVDRCVVSYQKNRSGEYSVLAVARANVLNKPVKQWVLPSIINPQIHSVKSLCLNSDKQPAARIFEITYDGFGRQIAEQDPSGRVIRQRYNSLGQLTDTINSVGDRIHSVYDITGKIVQSWAYPVSGEHYLLSSASYNAAGQLRWSAGEDGKRTFYTYTEDGRLAMVTTPGKHTFTWKYNILGIPVNQFTDNKFQWSCDYDPITLKLQKKTDNTGITTYIYSDDGLLLTLVHAGKNSYSNYQLQWQYDNNRREISATDISGNKIQNSYDGFSRISNVSYISKQKNQAEIIFKPIYDGFSRINSIDYGSQIHRTIHYDTWGNQDQIIDKQGIQLISKWQFRYDINGNIVRLKQTAENSKYSLLYYRYDALNNLVRMTCNGSSGLPLCPRDTAFSGSKLSQPPVIIRQDYTFTLLNSVSAVQETLQNIQQKKTINKITSYLYGNACAPLRLQKISTAWNQHNAVVHNFIYDNSGNMVVDGQENHITYNSMNEISSVLSPAGRQSDYIYDGSGKQVMEKSQFGVSYLFYRGNSLINEKIIDPGENMHITGYLGIAKTTDGLISEYYESSYKGDIIGIFKKQDDRHYRLFKRNIYSPYGMVWSNNATIKPLYQQTLQGFNGERTDPATKWQFLGAGHRTYNPQQRYFVSEDPGGDGYAFGSNNPVMNTDPSGNSPAWLGSIFKWAGYISTLGLSALNQRWANITASVIQAGLSIASMGATAAGAGPAALAGVIAGTAAIGSIPIMAAALPANKGLNIAASIIGMTEMAVTVVAAAESFFTGLCGAMTKRTGYSTIPFCMLKLKTGDWCCAPDSDFFDGFLIGVDEDAMIASISDNLELSIDLLFFENADYSLAINNFLLYKASGLITLGNYFMLDTKEKVEVLWELLRFSPFQTNIACDTGAILLMAYRNSKCMPVTLLTSFLAKRRPYVGTTELLDPNHPYMIALKNILISLRKEGSRKTYNFVRYNLLGQIFANHSGNAAIISGGNAHIAVVEKFKIGLQPWRIYQFNSDGTLDTIQGHYKDISQFFINSRTKEVLINGYIMLD